MAGILVSVRLSEDAVLGIRGIVGDRGRSAFIQEAVDAALRSRSGGPIVPAGVDPSVVRPDVVRKAPAVVAPKKRSGGRDFTDDFQRVLSALGEGPRALRPLAGDIGWDAGRLDRVLAKMDGAGLLSYVGGVARRV